MELQDLYTVEHHEKGSELRIKSPIDNKNTDFYITLMGVDSKEYRKAVREYQRRVMKGDEPDEIALLVSITKSWRGLMSGGEEVKCTPDSARALYENSPAIANQVDRFIADRRNFTKG